MCDDLPIVRVFLRAQELVVTTLVQRAQDGENDDGEDGYHDAVEKGQVSARFHLPFGGETRRKRYEPSPCMASSDYWFHGVDVL